MLEKNESNEKILSKGKCEKTKQREKAKTFNIRNEKGNINTDIDIVKIIIKTITVVN